MTHLRQIMLEELERRNYAPGTMRCYIHVVEQFSRYFHRPPDQLGLEHIRQYQVALLRKKKLAPSTVGQHLAALRFFYIQVLKRGWSAAETPYPRPVLGRSPGLVADSRKEIWSRCDNSMRGSKEEFDLS